MPMRTSLGIAPRYSLWILDWTCYLWPHFWHVYPYPEPVVFQWQPSGNPVCLNLRPECALERHWRNSFCKHLNSPASGIRDDNGGDGGGILIPALYRYLTSSEWLNRWDMNCLRGGRVVTRGVGACQFDSHRRLWWRRAVVAAAFIFPRPVKLITDFIEFYNIYITTRTERTCWKY